MTNRTYRNRKKRIALCMAVAVSLSLAGCGGDKKEPKPEPKATAKVDEGNANADGRGEGQADVPLVVGTGTFSRVFNPFGAETEADRQAVDLTQVRLVTNDRAGRIVYHGIDGELRKYGEESYTYYGASDLSIQYDKEKNSTVYQIKIRDDLSFSDGQKLTVDDVIFSLYVFCDNSYSGAGTLKSMPIKGLLNYQADSSKAEQMTVKSLAKKINKKGNAFRRWLKKQGEASLAASLSGKLSVKKCQRLLSGSRELLRQGRIYFSRGKGKCVKGIAGIRRLGDYQCSIETVGYDREMSSALQIPICALHYYGDVSKYHPGAGSYGFRRGDVSSVLANKSTPMGAGAYRFVKYEEGVAYYNSNELYFLGCPKIAFLQLKEMTDILAETKKTLAKKAEEESAASAQQKGSGEQTPPPTTNPSGEVAEIKGGTVDVLRGTFRGEELNWITGVNSNEELEGGTVTARLVSDGTYRYLGIHGGNVSVGGQPGSSASKSLRRAFAVLFSAARGVLESRDGLSVDIVSHPMGRESWVAPDDEEYRNPFETDLSGEALYTSEETAAERMAAAKKEALKALEEAGYTLENGKVAQAPQGASSAYSLWIANGEKNPLYAMVERVAEELEDMGMKLQIVSLPTADALEAELDGGNQQLWIGTRRLQDVDLQGRYASGGEENIFGLSDTVLDRKLKKLGKYLTSQRRKRVYGECLDQVMDWGVEVPVCEYRDALLFSSARVKRKSIPGDLTFYYSWLNEVQKIEMK